MVERKLKPVPFDNCKNLQDVAGLVFQLRPSSAIEALVYIRQVNEAIERFGRKDYVSLNRLNTMLSCWICEFQTSGAQALGIEYTKFRSFLKEIQVANEVTGYQSGVTEMLQSVEPLAVRPDIAAAKYGKNSF